MINPVVEVKEIDPTLFEKINANIEDESKHIGLPDYKTIGAAGVDLAAAITEPVVVRPNETVRIPTNIGYNMMNPNIMLKVQPRSGLGSRGLILGNLIGLIDSDYQGDIILVAWNRLSNEDIVIQPAERIAQATFEVVVRPTFKKVTEFTTATERGDGGFGSTGQ